MSDSKAVTGRPGSASTTARDRLFVALDTPDLDGARRLVDALAGTVERYKVGLELFAGEGPRAVADLRERGARVFLDLKLHDIPETVRRAAERAAATGAEWLTVHAAGGPAMLDAAVKGAGAQTGILAVTVLTSMERADLAAIGTVVDSVEALVVQRARLAEAAGCAGVIASPKEAAAVRAAVSARFLVVTPGIRFADGNRASPDDQKRVDDPGAAITAGADAIVVGRPIRDASDPRAAAERFLRALDEAAAAKGAR